ncbi:MAG: prepilin peptidase, partial [Planctomycetota bacterium]
PTWVSGDTANSAGSRTEKMDHSGIWLPNYHIQLHLPYLIFIFALGGVVGSFLNVVILRLPRGENIISPPSHCPNCGHRLRWFENLPIVGYLFVKGRCTSCGRRISLQYPLIELLCAVMFGGIFVLYYMITPGGPTFVNHLAPPWLPESGFTETWPILILHLLMLAGLLGMTIIDLRTFQIPILIPTFISVLAVPIHALMPILPGSWLRMPLEEPGLSAWIIPLASPAALGACLLGLVGIFISTMLLRRADLRPAYHDFDLWVGPEDPITAYPYARREIEWELDFLGPVVIGLMLGALIGGGLARMGGGEAADLPLWASAMGGSLFGWFAGFGIVWAIRLLGTVGFGKEAMGLGDAYLLAAVGAVLGWVDVVLIFFIAPFFGIAGFIVQQIVASIARGRSDGSRDGAETATSGPDNASGDASASELTELPWWEAPLPYGPWLALATVVVMFGDHWIAGFLSVLMQSPIHLP